jgi:hypothetical protein
VQLSELCFYLLFLEEDHGLFVSFDVLLDFLNFLVIIILKLDYAILSLLKLLVKLLEFLLFILQLALLELKVSEVLRVDLLI